VDHDIFKQLQRIDGGGSSLAIAVAVGDMLWVMVGYSNCCGLPRVDHGCFSNCCELLEVGHVWLQLWLCDISGGSWVTTAIAVDCLKWVMGAYSNCCELLEVGHGWLQQLL
jgi:hypothetical protein